MAVPGSLARRYAPFLILAGVQVLLVALVPSTGGPASRGQELTAGPGGSAVGGADAGADGVFGTADDVAGGPGSAGSANGPGGAGGSGANGGGGPGGGGTRGTTGDKSKCARDGVRQQDVTRTSPPCVPRWTGDNGGGTYQGVSATEVKVVHYRPKSNEQVDAILRTQGLASSPAEEEKARNAFAAFFEKHYEFYGRKINWIYVQGRCEITPPATACFRDEAKTINDTHHPFAMFWTNATVQGELFEQWTALGVVNIGGWHFHNDFVTRNRPYHWDVFMDGTRTVQNLASYWCRKMAGKNATLAGTPDLQAKRRKLGVITQNYEYTRKNAQDLVALVRGGMCGTPGDAADPVYTPSDITRAQETASTAMQKLQGDGVTTVVFLSDPIGPRFFTNAATAQRWYPEHLLAGSGLIDYDVLGRLYETSQWRNAFGPGHLADPIPFNDSDAARAAADVGVTGLYSGANLLYAYMSLVASQIQMAGPNLTPLNVERGMLRLPTSGGWERSHDPASVMVKFGPGDYTAIEDSRHTYWDPTARSRIDGGTGAYIAIENGRRWPIGAWGPGEPRAAE